ncbi:transposase [Rhodohalobacter sp. 8-1]|uniref:transposase n=1 Tax=Rhodohalobacter sp. 8-1 TaxID=3131972 RepID=UPI0030ECCC8A
MINYTSQYQTQFEDFSNLCQLELHPANRWIQLGALLPWDRMVEVYAKRFSPNMGAKAVNPRWVIGAFIIKHKLRLTDEETLLSISENLYMQVFLGLETYRPTQLFSPTLFVELRKRLGEDTFDEFSRTLITLSEDIAGAPGAADTPSGKVKVDATVADQYIRYPTDLSLVNEAREKTERIIDELWELMGYRLPVKPRTYRKVAHKRYLSQSKKKKASRASLRKTLRYLLNCVKRNLRHIDQMLGMLDRRAFPLAHKYQRQLWVIHTLYAQQRGMYDADSRRCDDRIVSISQPHVRPIVRGETGKRVEFGAKLGLSLFGGYLTHQTLSWDA